MIIIKALILATIIFVWYKVNWTKLWWFLNDWCSECGSTVSERINGKYYCDNEECGVKN